MNLKDLQNYRKMRKYTFIVLIILLFLSACEDTIYIDIPDNGRKLVLYSTLIKGEPVEASVSQSNHVYGNDVFTYPAATVTLYIDGQKTEELNYQGDGVYLGTSIVEPNKTYKIEAVADGLETVSAENSLPTQPNIVSLIHSEDDPQGYSMTLNLVLDDNGNTTDYYYIEMFIESTFSYFDTFLGKDIVETYSSTGELYSDDPIINDNLWALDGLLFNDSHFNGKQYRLLFYSESYMYNDKYKLLVTLTETHTLRINSVSKSYYQYMYSYALFMTVDENPFAEPVQVYTNVSNGFGFVGGLSYHEFTFEKVSTDNYY